MVWECEPFPNGSGTRGICVTIGVAIAFLLSLSSSSMCNFLELDNGNRWRNRPFNVDGIGFWCYEKQNGDRKAYSGILANSDGDFDTARDLGFVANLLGLIVWMIYLLSCCVRFPPTGLFLVSFLCFIVAMFEGFKFWMLRSTFFCDGPELGCSNYKGGSVSITAIIMWCLVGFACLLYGKDCIDTAKREIAELTGSGLDKEDVDVVEPAATEDPQSPQSTPADTDNQASTTLA